MFRIGAIASVFVLTAALATACGDASSNGGGAKLSVVPGRVVQLNACKPCAAHSTPNIVDVVKSLRPEVIGLQEACGDDVREAAARLRDSNLDYNVVAGPTGTLNSSYRCLNREDKPEGTFGNYLLTANQVENSGSKEYGFASSEKRGYVWADTGINGVGVRVFVTQLPQAGQGAARTANVKQLVQAAAPSANDQDPTIVIGDFNARPALCDPQTQRCRGGVPELAPMWQHWRDADPNCYPQMRFAETFEPTRGRCKGTQLGPYAGKKGQERGTGKKFDYIWLDRRSSTRPSGIVVQPAFTDHSLVYVDLQPSDLVPAGSKIPGSPQGQPNEICREASSHRICVHTDLLSGSIDFYGMGHGPYARPSAMYVGSNLVFGKLKWRHWGGKTATAFGTTSSTNCKPSCSEGKPQRIRVEIELSKIATPSRPGAIGGIREYTCARVRQVGKPWGTFGPGLNRTVCVKP